MIRPTPTGVEVDFIDGNFIYEIDKDGHITYANRTFVNFTGYNKKDLIGVHYSEIVDPHMPRTLFYCMQNSTGKGETWKGYSKNLLHNGDHYWAMAYVSPKEQKEEGYTVMYKAAEKEAVKAVAVKYEEIYELEKKGQDTTGLIKNIIIGG